MDLREGIAIDLRNSCPVNIGLGMSRNSSIDLDTDGNANIDRDKHFKSFLARAHAYPTPWLSEPRTQRPMGSCSQDIVPRTPASDALPHALRHKGPWGPGQEPKGP